MAAAASSTPFPAPLSPDPDFQRSQSPVDSDDRTLSRLRFARTFREDRLGHKPDNLAIPPHGHWQPGPTEEFDCRLRSFVNRFVNESPVCEDSLNNLWDVFQTSCLRPAWNWAHKSG
jgi:hypothetical protein